MTRARRTVTFSLAAATSLSLVISLALVGSLALLGCHRDHGGDAGSIDPDAYFYFPSNPDGNGHDSDGGPSGQAQPCGDFSPECFTLLFDPTQGRAFPVTSDNPVDKGVGGSRVLRDPNGFLALDIAHAGFHQAWTANTSDWAAGTVSKWDTMTLREVGRYFTVTCNSLPGGARIGCDGKSGCCALDSYPQFQNRQNQAPEGSLQQVQLQSNFPSRTAVDFNGDVWVANRAFGGQSSVTRIANQRGECVDRNHNGKIETSEDINGDGIIETDCNGDSIPDDSEGVKAIPCKNGMAQEFYGLDDECVILTTNTGASGGAGRPLALAPGTDPFGPSDVWAGLYYTNQVFRIDGATGKAKEMTTLPCDPYGFAIDSSLIGWASNGPSGPAGCYWDTRNIKNTGMIRQSSIMQYSYGIGLDRDGNVWFGSLSPDGARYTPNRAGNFADLGAGLWTIFQGAGGAGVAVDSRSPGEYFAYFAGMELHQVPASAIPVPKLNDIAVNMPWKSVPVFGGGGKGVDIAADGNVVVTSFSKAGLQRVRVGAQGNMAMPDLLSPPNGGNRCPSGDYCNNEDHGPMDPYTYSDFTGFGLRNFTHPGGNWTYRLKGCISVNGTPVGTKWVHIRFAAETPLHTRLSVKARAGNTEEPDQTWGQWIADQTVSPVDLVKGAVLAPNWNAGNGNPEDQYLEVEVDLQTTDTNVTPRLHSLEVDYECIVGPQ